MQFKVVFKTYRQVDTRNFTVFTFYLVAKPETLEAKSPYSYKSLGQWAW